LQTLNKRMTATSATADAVAAYLEAHPAVNRVMYPTLPSHPTYSLAQQYLTRGGPGCIWFHVGAAKKVVMSILAHGGGGPECKTSFGASSARVDPWPQQRPSNAWEWPRSENQGLEGTWLRLAVGYAEPLGETKAALDVLLAQLFPANTTVLSQPKPMKEAALPQQEAAPGLRWKRR
ncbi:CGS2, partial [Symbiodinium natans]